MTYDADCAVLGILCRMGSHLSFKALEQVRRLGGKARQQDRYVGPRRLSNPEDPLEESSDRCEMDVSARILHQDNTAATHV